MQSQMAHYDIFRDRLGVKYPALGHALWEPSPGELYPPVEVGDVGFIREGKFHRLFNALLDADHPSQTFGVPECHEPLRPRLARHIDSGTLSSTDFCSYGVTVAGGVDVFAREPVGAADVSFSCSRTCGAALSLPVKAQRKDTIARGDFGKWITKNIDSWFAFAQRLGLGIEHMEDIVLVTGHHRTGSWTNIAFFENSRVTLGVQVTGGGVGASVNWQVSREHIQGAMLSEGPSGRDLPEDQCIFVRGFRVVRAFKLFPRLKGAAGHTQDPGEHDRGPELEVIPISSFPKYKDPLHVLLEHIAERAPECALALVHDDDLDRLCRTGDEISQETLLPTAVVDRLQRSEPEIAQVTCGHDALPSGNDTPRTNTRGSMVALFSAELNSWGGEICVSQRRATTPVPVSPPIPPVVQTPTPIPAATQAPTLQQRSRPSPQNPFQLDLHADESKESDDEHSPLSARSNHPNPAIDTAQSPSNMIGATPTYYDPEQDTQPRAQDYQHWIDNNYRQTSLVYSNTPSYPPQPSVSDFLTSQPSVSHPRVQQQMQSHPTQRQSRVPTSWPQQPSAEFTQPPPSSDDPAYYLMTTTDQYSGMTDSMVRQQQQQYSSPAEHLTDTPGVALTPGSDATLWSISPAWTDNKPLPPHGTSSSNTPASSVTFQMSPKPTGKRTLAQGKTTQRKRQKPRTDTDDDDSDDVEANVGANMSRPNRLPGACTYCKRLRMKCTFPPGENVCKRCKTGKHDCIVEGRKPRSAPNKREYLLAQMKQKDAIIESLLKQLHNPYLATPLSIEAYRMATPSSDPHRDAVNAWLDRLQSSVRSPPVRLGPVKNPFQLDTHTGDSEKSDDEQTQQQHVPLRQADIDAYVDDAVPIGLLANRPAVSAEKKGWDNADDDDDDMGVASRRFFMPGPSQNLNLALRKSSIDKISPPDILVHKLVTPEDVEKLFDIFYTRINPFISLLDPKLHTPVLTFSRCPLLFTVVCAIASRYSDKPEVYPIAMHFAKSAAANALVDGWKSVELCQAYILMSIYAVPARWEEDCSWLYAGLAIRIATDLNLHLLPQKKPMTEQQELEMLNRTRVWIICFNLDKSTAMQFGKPSTLKEDYIMRHPLEWYKASNHNHPYDVHIIAYSSLFRIINQFHQKMFSDLDVLNNGLNRSIDFRAVTLEYDQLLHDCREEWAERFARDSDPNDPACEFRAKLLPFHSNYAMLVMFSFGFQEAFQRGFQAGDEVFFTRSLDCAKTVVTVLVDTLVPTGYIRFAPDGYFVFAAFASAFMLKLLHPQFSRFITPGLETEIYQVIERLINTIGSPQIAIDERHTPMLYSRFLASLLAKHKRDGSARGRLHQQGPPTQQPPASSTAPAYQQQRQTAQQGPPSHSASPSSFATGGNPTTVQDVPPAHSTVTLDGKPPTVTQSANHEPMHQVETPYTFGATTGQSGAGAADADGMDFTFDISIDELLGPMKAIENPLWMQTMMLPGFSWPTDESYPSFGNNMAGDGFQNYMAPQPTAMHLD